MRTLVFLIFIGTSVWANAQPVFSFRESVDRKKMEVFYDKKLITAYCYFDSTEKPVLFPIKTISGITVTRGYPIAPRAGERTDHPHQVGLWLNYESVNGLDFWNNSSAIAPDKKSKYGSIKHQNFVISKVEGEKATLRAHCHWIDYKGTLMVEEITEFVFRVEKGTLIIDRASELKAMLPEIEFLDVKDGLLGLRVARELEMPSKQADTFVDSHGVATTVPKISDAGVTGLYVNREGIKGDDTWGKRSMWTSLNGMKDGEHVSIAIIDHPFNAGTPTYWHARGYGLFAANPLGQKVFSDGKEEFNFRLTKGQTTTFRYRVLIHSGQAFLTPAEVESFMSDFATRR